MVHKTYLDRNETEIISFDQKNSQWVTFDPTDPCIQGSEGQTLGQNQNKFRVIKAWNLMELGSLLGEEHNGPNISKWVPLIWAVDTTTDGGLVSAAAEKGWKPPLQLTLSRGGAHRKYLKNATQGGILRWGGGLLILKISKFETPHTIL